MTVVAAGLRGGRGDSGPPFRVDAQGTLAERDNYNTQLANFTYLATDNGYLYFKGSLPGQWSEGMLFRGPKGDTGAGFVLRGSLASPDGLPMPGALGDAWLIDGHAWTWNGTGWTDAGQIQGEKGDPGIDGATGRGVSALAVNETGHLIVTFTDSSTADAGVVRGADGVSVTGAAVTAGKHLELALSNGQTLDAGLVPTVAGADGADGQNGTDGRGITGVAIDGAGHLILTYSDTSTVDAGLVKGADGQDGTNGSNGTDGVGITGVAVNVSGHLIVTLTGGGTVDAGLIPVVNGTDGSDGQNGIGIASAVIDGTGHLVLTYSDESSADLGVVKGAAGLDGQDGTNGTNGVGIASVAVDESKHLIVTLTNSSIIDAGAIPIVNGTNGTDGADGRGITSTSIDGNGHLIVTYTDTSTADLGKVVGADGAAGADGTNGTAGADGSDGIGIASVAIDGSNHLIVTYTDASTHDAGALPAGGGAGAEEVLALQASVSGILLSLDDTALVDGDGVPLTDGAGQQLTVDSSGARQSPELGVRFGGALLNIGDPAMPGNPRGYSSIDLQAERYNPDEVASGDNSVICGGYSNKAPGYRAAIGGGSGNHASGISTTIGGGTDNQSAGALATIGGGSRNQADAECATIPGGTKATTRGTKGAMAYAGAPDANYLAEIGASQTRLVLLGGKSTDANTTWLSADRNSNYNGEGQAIKIPPNGLFMLNVKLICVAGNESRSFEYWATCRRLGTGNVAWVSGNYSQSTRHASANASGWTAGITLSGADTIHVWGKGVAGSGNMTWFARAEITELVLP